MPPTATPPHRDAVGDHRCRRGSSSPSSFVSVVRSRRAGGRVRRARTRPGRPAARQREARGRSWRLRRRLIVSRTAGARIRGSSMMIPSITACDQGLLRAQARSPSRRIPRRRRRDTHESQRGVTTAQLRRLRPAPRRGSEPARQAPRQPGRGGRREPRADGPGGAGGGPRRRACPRDRSSDRGSSGTVAAKRAQDRHRETS